jgi:hypothetical protein
VNRLTSISLLLLYLVSFTEFREILRLPLLVEHFQEHKGQVAEMSFLDFLVMHYETDVPHDDTDMSLPFKDCSHSPNITLAATAPHRMALQPLPEMNSPAYSSFYLQHEPKLLTVDIFQPPKL